VFLNGLLRKGVIIDLISTQDMSLLWSTESKYLVLLAAFEHVHNYLASELERLAKMEAGAMVLNGVADLLIEAKARLLRTDGLLPLADLISNSLHDLPGLGR